MSPRVDATIRIEAAFEVFEGRGLKPHLLHLGAGPIRGVVTVNLSEFTSVNYLTVFVKAKVCIMYTTIMYLSLDTTLIFYARHLLTIYCMPSNAEEWLLGSRLLGDRRYFNFEILSLNSDFRGSAA